MTGDEQEITNHDPESRLESGFQKKKKKKKKRQLRVPCLIWGILSMDEKLYDIMEFLQNV